MKKNIGSVDRLIRVLAGIIIIVVGIYYQNWWGVLGLIPLLTAFVGLCPLYSAFGISSCRKKEIVK